MTRPSFQFYPDKWLSELGLKGCSAATHGVWISMLALMHQAEPYGHLAARGKPITPAKLASMLGFPASVVRKALVELEEERVFSRMADGTIYSRRMVRDEQLRLIRAEGGKAGAEHGAKGAEHGIKGGRPATPHTPPLDPRSEQPDKPPLEGAEKTPLDGGQQIPPPASASASATATAREKQEEPPPTPPLPGGFVAFWTAYPSSDRKTAKRDCLNLWRRQRLEAQAERIVAHVEASKASETWLRGFSPKPRKYLADAQFDCPIEGPPSLQLQPVSTPSERRATNISAWIGSKNRQESSGNSPKNSRFFPENSQTTAQKSSGFFSENTQEITDVDVTENHPKRLG